MDTSCIALVLLLVLAISIISVRGQSSQLKVELPSESVNPGEPIKVTVGVEGVSTGAYVRLNLAIVSGNKTICHEEKYLTVKEPEIVYFEITAPDNPGVYSLIISLHSQAQGANTSQEVPLFVIPSLKYITSIALKLADIDDGLEKLRMVKFNNTEITDLLQSRAKLSSEFGYLVRLIVEDKDPKRAAQLYDVITKSLNYLDERIKEIWNVELMVWSVSSSIDSSLRMPPSVSLEFWYRIITASLWVMLILLALFPLYTTGYTTLTYYLVSEMKESSYVIEQANKRALAILERAYEQIKWISDPKSMILTALASALAAIGLMANNVYAIIGSMLLSPLMGAIVSGAVGLALIDVRKEDKSGLDLFYTGLKLGVEGIFIIIALSWITAVIANSYVPLQVTKELAARGSPNLVDLAIAIAAGFAGAVAMTYEKAEAALAGSAIAIALVPPAAAVGVSMAMLNPSFFVGSATLVTVNIIALIAAGYISAKLYAIYPVIEDVLREFMGSFNEASGRMARAGAEVVLRSIGSLIVASIWFLSVWIKVSVGLLGAKSSKEALKTVTRRVAFILSPIIFSWLIGFIISTNVSEAFSLAHLILLYGITPIINLISPLADILSSNTIFILDSALSLILLWLIIVEGARARKTGLIRHKIWTAIYTTFLWLISGYLLGINRFAHISAAYTILLLSMVVVYSNPYLWERRKKIVLFGFILFTFLTLMIHSAAAFESMRASQTLSTSNVVKVIKEVISSYAGVLPSDVNVSMSSKEAEWVLHAKIYISESQLRKGHVMTPAVVKAAQQTLKDALGIDIKLFVEYAITP